MSQKAIIFTTCLTAFVFAYGFFLELATMRMLIIRSLLTGIGTIVAIGVAKKGFETITSPSPPRPSSIDNLDLEEILEEEQEKKSTASTESGQDQADVSEELLLSDSESEIPSGVDDDDLQDELEKQVKDGNEEGVQEIADLISDSMESES